MIEVLDWKLRGKVTEALKSIALSEVIRFYPTYIAEITNLSLKEIISAMKVFQIEGTVDCKWEFICEDCGRNILTLDTLPIEDLSIVCKYCGFENDFSYLEANMVIEINEDYKKFLIQQINETENNSKKKRRQMLVLV